MFHHIVTIAVDGVLPGGLSVSGLPKYSKWPETPNYDAFVSLASGGLLLPSWRGAATLLERYNIKQAKCTKWAQLGQLRSFRPLLPEEGSHYPPMLKHTQIG